MCCHWMHHQFGGFFQLFHCIRNLLKEGKKSTRLSLGEHVQHFSWRDFSYPYLNYIKKEKVTRQDSIQAPHNHLPRGCEAPRQMPRPEKSLNQTGAVFAGGGKKLLMLCVTPDQQGKAFL